jgi:5-formyltetrahydrofolate cyclo-ligase
MPAAQKKLLRRVMKERRQALFQNHPSAGIEICSHFFNSFKLRPNLKIAGYWPWGSELDLKPLLYRFIDEGFECALPVITPEGMIFRKWTPETPLITGPFTMLEPPSTAPLVTPDLIFVPLLAFDKDGHRLGYGQGHFDKYLHQHKAITIGVGFSGQEVDKIPRQSHDFALEYLLTEKGLIGVEIFSKSF